MPTKASRSSTYTRDFPSGQKIQATLGGPLIPIMSTTTVRLKSSGSRSPEAPNYRSSASKCTLISSAME
ncbi:hypothetical protein D5086_015332 [Populus alba]|uniref:Uncharacterized protein n=1 Tax=Populus alba TaxID=43335 RepID=A0ACC4C1T3_POPAL